MANLTNNNKSVDFSFGGQLDAWQIQSILHNAGSSEKEDILDYLSGKDGWNEDNINEFIDFINSEEFNELHF